MEKQNRVGEDPVGPVCIRNLNAAGKRIAVFIEERIRETFPDAGEEGLAVIYETVADACAAKAKILRRR